MQSQSLSPAAANRSSLPPRENPSHQRTDRRPSSISALENSPSMPIDQPYRPDGFVSRTVVLRVLHYAARIEKGDVASPFVTHSRPDGRRQWRSSDRRAAFVQTNRGRRIGRIFRTALIAGSGSYRGYPDLPVAKMKRNLLVGRLTRLALIAGLLGRFGGNVLHYRTPFPSSLATMLVVFGEYGGNGRQIVRQSDIRRR